MQSGRTVQMFQIILLHSSSNLITLETDYAETSSPYKTTRCFIPEDDNVFSHCLENLYIIYIHTHTPLRVCVCVCIYICVYMFMYIKYI